MSLSIIPIPAMPQAHSEQQSYSDNTKPFDSSIKATNEIWATYSKRSAKSASSAHRDWHNNSQHDSLDALKLASVFNQQTPRNLTSLTNSAQPLAERYSNRLTSRPRLIDIAV